MRPEFIRLSKGFRGVAPLAEFLGVTLTNLKVMRHRGYLSEKVAMDAELLSNGAFRAKLLAKKGTIK